MAERLSEMVYEREEKCGNWLLKKAVFRKVIERDRKSSLCSIASLNLVNGSVTELWFTNGGAVWIEEGWC